MNLNVLTLALITTQHKLMNGLHTNGSCSSVQLIFRMMEKQAKNRKVTFVDVQDQSRKALVQGRTSALIICSCTPLPEPGGAAKLEAGDGAKEWRM